MSKTKSVLIVGAGPTGMTAAMELSRLGVPIRIVDKLLEPSTTSRSLAVQARTLELFEQPTLLEEMLRIGNPGTAATIYGKVLNLGIWSTLGGFKALLRCLGFKNQDEYFKNISEFTYDFFDVVTVEVGQ